MNSSLCWIRRDLRLHDHAALHHASGETHLVFVFDPLILGKLEDKEDRRVTFIIDSLKEMEAELQKRGSSIHILYGDPVQEIPKLALKLKVDAVFTNRDYEPYAKKRDGAVEKVLNANGIAFHTYADSVIFEKTQVLTGQGQIYKVFTPYKSRWLEILDAQGRQIPDWDVNLSKLATFKNPRNIIDHDWHRELGFVPTSSLLPGGASHALKRLKNFEHRLNDYKDDRDIPSIDGTSLLSVYLRHGCLSVRDMVRLSLTSKSTGAQTWLSEIVWRDFYQVILDAYPHVEKESFKRQYDQIKWLGGEKEFKAWCQGETGFPLVDAAMRCLNQTGLMHNRLRMVTASFLCKTLLVDWRWGEKYFAQKLLDFDLAANNGGWQWCSSSGCDAQPYFRIFNPYTQSEKFDPDGLYIREWVPELAHLTAPDIHHPDPLLAPDYPQAIVDYERSRAKALGMYAVVKEQ